MKSEMKTVVPDLREFAADEIPEPRQDAYKFKVITLNLQPRFDANIEKKVRSVLESVEAELTRLFPETVLQKWAWSMINHTNEKAKKGVKKFTSQVGLEMGAIMHDRGLSPFFQNIVDENVGLIRSITRAKQDTLKNGLVSLITADAPAAQISKMIQENFNTSKAKAKLIARDQVGKLNGRINQFRQQQLGGKRYIWRGSMDERERDDHKKLQGKTFSWDNPPITNRSTGARNHPGGDFQCRCRAEMVLEDILE